MEPFIKPLGVAELKVVKQKLAKYEAGEIAHIENVMASEWRGREHRRLRQLEEIFTIEEERSEENTRDLQSTERFELQQEAQEVIKSETKWNAGVEVSAKYGPVSVKAFYNYASTNSKEESERSATNYAKEVTNKTLNKVIEKVRKLRTTRIFEEFEEKNKHEFDNRGVGSTNISGIYRWVDKYYRAKVVSYGRRLMYAFTIPEPAAFYIFAKNSNIIANILPEVPVIPRRLLEDNITYEENQPLLAPSDITPYNYNTYIRIYGADGINPPPRHWISIMKTFTKEVQYRWPENNNDITVCQFSDAIEIPKGYCAIYGYYKIELNKFDDITDKDNTHVYIGQDEIFIDRIDRSDAVRRDIIPHPKHSLLDEFGKRISARKGMLNFKKTLESIPVSFMANQLYGVSLNIQVICQPTGETYKKWELETYNAIMNAYYKQLMDYEEKLAAAQIQNSIKITGRNPAINREIEMEELKKACLMLWTQDDFNLGSGIRTNNNENSVFYGYPEIDIAANGWATKRPDDIQFLEQAFDWKNMMYEFHPYYWGDKKKWTKAFNYEDTDPLFESFLKSGAATVIVPVHLQASEAVLYFQLTGKLHPGGKVPGLTPPEDSSTTFSSSHFSVESNVDSDIALYHSYLDELSDEEAEDDIERDVEISADDPDTWLIKVPTNLVWLQNENPGQQLPNYEP